MRSTTDDLGIGELVDQRLGERIVVVGGHLDAWDLGRGAHDDGAGCIHALEAVRLLQACGIRPRCTIRVVLFANEENGLRGAKAYAEAHRDEMARHVGALGVQAEVGGDRRRDEFAVLGGGHPLLRASRLARPRMRTGGDITGRIAKIQATTGAAVQAMTSVRTTIARVSEISAAIAAAVEEQTAATKEISGNATQAATGTEEVARNIEGVSRAADDAGSAAAQVREASSELAKQAEALRHEVDSFIARVRSE